MCVRKYKRPSVCGRNLQKDIINSVPGYHDNKLVQKAIPDEGMIEIVSSLIEKLQQIEDKYFYALDLDSYLIAAEGDVYVD